MVPGSEGEGTTMQLQEQLVSHMTGRHLFSRLPVACILLLIGLLLPSQASAQAPTNLSATGGPGHISLSWTAPSGYYIQYSIYRSTTTATETTPAIVSGLYTTTYTDSNVTVGTTYYYVVTALPYYGTESGYSNEASAAATAGPPSAPTGLSATAGNL